MIYIENTDSNIWNEYLLKIDKPNRDIYFTSSYHHLYENKHSRAKCFIYCEDEKVALYPFLINDIYNYDLDDKYYDIETVYGYGGPISNSDNEEFLVNFEKNFMIFCSQNRIIAEFIRFHPLIKNQNIFKKNIDVVHNRLTVYLDLEKGIDQIWNKDIKSKNRNMIRKAQNNELSVSISSDYKTFKNIYEKTMNKVNANSFYYFNDEYFDLIKDSNNFILLNVNKNEKTIASGIFMIYGDYFHYHLSGSLEEYLKFASNNLLLWEAVKLAHKNNTKIFHFGGGLSNSREDNLFKFKSSFSNDATDFYIGKRIHNQKIYEHLIKIWEIRNNKQSKLFLQYKY